LSRHQERLQTVAIAQLPQVFGEGLNILLEKMSEYFRSPGLAIQGVFRDDISLSEIKCPTDSGHAQYRHQSHYNCRPGDAGSGGHGQIKRGYKVWHSL